MYASCNGILAHCKDVDEIVKLSRIKAYCLPIGVLDIYAWLSGERFGSVVSWLLNELPFE